GSNPLPPTNIILCFQSDASRNLPTFPTRRSSDLDPVHVWLEPLEVMLLRHSEDHAPDASAEAGGEVRHLNASAVRITGVRAGHRPEDHTFEPQSRSDPVCRLLREKKKLLRWQWPI